VKIKFSHVTNSSSCSYIVCIPKGLDSEKLVNETWEKFDKALIEEYCELTGYTFEQYSLYSKEGFKEIKNEIVLKIDRLKTESIFESDYSSYGVLVNILEECKLVVGSVDTGSQMGEIINIDVRETLNILRKHSDWIEKALKGVSE